MVYSPVGDRIKEDINKTNQRKKKERLKQEKKRNEHISYEINSRSSRQIIVVDDVDTMEKNCHQTEIKLNLVETVILNTILTCLDGGIPRHSDGMRGSSSLR